jgi:putative NADH-flavin reductase
LALKAGHKVTAILRTPSKLDITHPNLQIIQGDVLKPGTLDQYLYGKNVVICAIGKNSLKKNTVFPG